MGDTRKWAADHDEDIRIIKDLIKKNKVSNDLAWYIKDLMLFADKRRLTKEEREDIVSSIRQLVDVLRSVSGIEKYTALKANVYVILHDEAIKKKKL